MSTVDLSKLPPPQVIEELSFDQLRQARIDRLQELDEDLFNSIEPGDPILETFNVAAYREMLLRARINDAARAVLLPTSFGTNLDNIGADWDVLRLILQAEDLTTNPPTPEIKESDESFKNAIHEKPRTLGTGTKTRYERAALQADSRIADVHGHVPAPAQLILEWAPDVGVDPADYPEIATNLMDYMQGTDAEGFEIILLTDLVTEQVASPINFDIIATLDILPGPSASSLVAEATANAQAHAALVRQVRSPNLLSEIYQALSSPEGVVGVELASPSADGPSTAASYYELQTLSVSFRIADWV